MVDCRQNADMGFVGATALDIEVSACARFTRSGEPGTEAAPETSGALWGIAQSQGISTTQMRIGDLTKAVGGSGKSCIFQT